MTKRLAPLGLALVFCLDLVSCSRAPIAPEVQPEKPTLTLPREEVTGTQKVVLPERASRAKVEVPVVQKPVIRPSFEAGRLPPELEVVEARYREAQTVQAQFTQINETAATGQKKTSTGVLYARRPNQVRWETQSPDASLLVSDGKKFWFYTPPFDEGERGQLIEKPASQVQTQLLNALLSGNFDALRDQKKMRIEPRGNSRFILFPLKGTAGTVRRAEVKIAPERHEIEQVILDHEGGNRSEIQLSKIALGKKLKDELFRFTPPTNTDRLEP